MTINHNDDRADLERMLTDFLAIYGRTTLAAGVLILLFVLFTGCAQRVVVTGPSSYIESELGCQALKSPEVPVLIEHAQGALQLSHAVPVRCDNAPVQVLDVTCTYEDDGVTVAGCWVAKVLQ